MDKGLLKRALEDTEDPTPGYMFRDIAQWTFIDHNTQTKLTGLLFDKLKPSTSVHVLSKTLKVIKILCETGHTDFQKEMQRKSDELKQFASYRGKQDAKYGDKLNEKVRQTAREAIDAAFSHRKETVKVQAVSGMGSDTRYNEEKAQFTTGNTVPGASSSGPQQTNTGHPNIAAMPTTNKWAQHMATNGASSQQPGVVSSFVDAAKTGFGFWQEGVKSTEQRVMESMSGGSDFRPAELGFGPSATSHATSSSSAAGGGWKFTEDGQGGSSGLIPKEQEAKIMTPFQMEVERICAFKNTPQRVELATFTSNCEEIHSSRRCDYEELAQLLDERLAQKYLWQQRLNVMSAIEALVRTLGVDSDVAQYFKENPEDVQRNVHVVQQSLKEKASKLLKLLSIPERSTNQVETFTNPSTAAAQQLNVATGAGTMSWASATPAPTAAPQQQQQSATDMDFGGMVVKNRGGQSNVKSTEDKTKLRKRAAMVVQEEEEPQPQQFSSNNNNGFGGGDGWGSSATTTTTQGGGGWDAWGDNNNNQQQHQQSGGWDIPQPPQQQQTQQRQTAASSQLDDFFGPSSVQPQQQHSVPSPPPQAVPAVAPPQAPVVQQNSTPPAPAGVNTQMIMQMQMQMQQLMSQLNLSDPNSVAQMQAMMAQQQQLMAMLAASTQQEIEAIFLTN